MNKITLEIPNVEIALDHVERKKAFQFTNLHFQGKEVIPIHESVSDGHREAHYSISGSRRITLLVDITEKGEWENIRVKK